MTADDWKANSGVEEFVTASELREFVYCQRSWYLARQGLLASGQAQKAMHAGIVFHEKRAMVAAKSNDPNPLRWAGALAVTAVLLLFLMKLLGH